MNIITHETERIHELQRQLHEAEQFTATVCEMRVKQRECRRVARLLSVSDVYSTEYAKRLGNRLKAVRESRDRLEAAVDRELRLLDSE